MILLEGQMPGHPRVRVTVHIVLCARWSKPCYMINQMISSPSQVIPTICTNATNTDALPSPTCRIYLPWWSYLPGLCGSRERPHQEMFFLAGKWNIVVLGSSVCKANYMEILCYFFLIFIPCPVALSLHLRWVSLLPCPVVHVLLQYEAESATSARIT